MDKKQLLRIARDASKKLFLKTNNSYQDCYAVVSDTGRVYYHPQQSCFGSIAQCGTDMKDGEKPLYFIFTHAHGRYLKFFTEKEDKLALKTYLDWALRRSPYSSAFLTKSVKVAHDEAVIIRCDIPPQMLVGAAALIRCRDQVPQQIKQWYKFRNHMPEDLAYIYGFYYDLTASHIIYRSKDSGHGVFNSGYVNSERLTNFLAHNMVLKSKLCSENNWTYSDILSAWGPNNKGCSTGTNKNILYPTLDDITKPVRRTNFFTGQPYSFGNNAIPNIHMQTHIAEFLKINNIPYALPEIMKEAA